VTVIWRLLIGAALIAAMVGGCSVVQPNPECRISERCDAVLAAARSVASLDGARVVVLWGRGQGFHAEVHVCYADGRNALVDVMGDGVNPTLKAGLREATWDKPPCR
jgi:hypothetical protein